MSANTETFQNNPESPAILRQEVSSHPIVGIDFERPLQAGFLCYDSQRQPQEIDLIARVDDPSQPDTSVVVFSFRKEIEAGQAPHVLAGVGLMSHADQTGPDGQDAASELPTLRSTEKLIDLDGRYGRGQLSRAVAPVSGGSHLSITIDPKSRSGQVRFDHNGFDSQAVLTTAEPSQAALDAPNRIEAMNKKARRQPSRFMRRLGKVGLSFGLLTTPHGVADMGFDAFQSQADVVHSIGQEIEDSSSWFSISHGKEALDQATNSVAAAVEAIDSGNTDYFAEQRAEFAAKYGKELITDEQRQTILTELSSASSNEEVINILNEFTAAYNVKVHLSTGKDGELSAPTSHDHGQLVEESRAVVDMFSLLPPSEFGSVFNVEDIEFAGVVEEDGKVLGGQASIGGSRVSLSVGSVKFGLPFLGTSIAPDHIVEHEISHTVNGTTYIENRTGGKLSLLKYELGRLTGYSYDPSIYAVTGGSDERFAELSADIFTSGIPNPDEGMRFASPESREELRLLIELEAILPGITARIADRFAPNTETGTIISGIHEQSTERQIILMLSALLAYAHRKRRRPDVISLGTVSDQPDKG